MFSKSFYHIEVSVKNTIKQIVESQINLLEKLLDVVKWNDCVASDWLDPMVNEMDRPSHKLLIPLVQEFLKRFIQKVDRVYASKFACYQVNRMAQRFIPSDDELKALAKSWCMLGTGILSVHRFMRYIPMLRRVSSGEKEKVHNGNEELANFFKQRPIFAIVEEAYREERDHLIDNALVYLPRDITKLIESYLNIHDSQSLPAIPEEFLTDRWE